MRNVPEADAEGVCAFIIDWMLRLGAVVRELGFVVSHPFARKKAKGWGTALAVGNYAPAGCVSCRQSKENQL